MAEPSLRSLLPAFVANGTAWVRQVRDQHLQEAGLANRVRERLQPYFDESVLSGARLKPVPIIPTPAFITELSGAGIRVGSDFGSMAGMTFGNVVLLSRRCPWTDELIFHELVHVVQYRLLGIPEFMRRYVMGWAANGFDYWSIPLERDAYALQARFERKEVFDAEQEIGRRLGL